MQRKLWRNPYDITNYRPRKSIHGNGVSGEQITADGTYVDVAVFQGDEFTYYEIKTGLSAQSCIREAMGAAGIFALAWGAASRSAFHRGRTTTR